MFVHLKVCHNYFLMVFYTRTVMTSLFPEGILNRHLVRNLHMLRISLVLRSTAGGFGRVLQALNKDLLGLLRLGMVFHCLVLLKSLYLLKKLLFMIYVLHLFLYSPS